MGKADFIIFNASAEGTLSAAIQTVPFQLDVDGRVRGCIGTWLGDVCKSIGVGIRLDHSGVHFK